MLKPRLRIAISLFYFTMLSTLTTAVIVTVTVESEAANSTRSGVQPLDGVQIDAVQSYVNPKSQQIDFGLGVWPLDAYYSGFSLDASYSYYFNKTYAWEVLHADYLYTVDKGLTSE